jgi:F420-non-reducing hydrogenase small subunit
MRRLKVAITWAGACGGCDVALLDLGHRLLELADLADIVYWPVAMDFKRSDLKALPPGSVDVGIFNGAVRTSEHVDDALLLRERCRHLVAFGACAACGGLPGLANLHDSSRLLDTAFGDTASTDNPDDLRPLERSEVAAGTLTLPALTDAIRPLDRVVPVDWVAPGCPPPEPVVTRLLGALSDLARSGETPPTGAVLAADTPLCEECPRAASRTGARLGSFVRPHQVIPDPERCLLEQGLVCLGPVTRGGCGALCLNVNMPCRGCFGAAPGLLDPAAELLSTLGSVAALDHEDELPQGRRLGPVRSLVDPAGTLYRFTLPSALVWRKVEEGSG